MAAANRKSTQITNADASPRVANDVRSTHGRIRVSKATVETAAADDANSVYRFVRVHSSWSVFSIIIHNDATADATDMDVGLYQTAENGGAALDKDCYTDGADMSAGYLTGVEYAFTTRAIENIGQRVYADGGESADTGLYYDLCINGVSDISAAGTFTMIVLYTAGD